MSTKTYGSDHSSTSFPRRNIRTSSTLNTMANEHSRFPVRPNHLLTPIPPIGESLSIHARKIRPSISTQSLTTSRHHFNTNESTSVKSSKQIYTYSNPPRELQRNRRSSNNSILRQRISSAPDENSPRSKLNQPKSLSANESMTPRSYVDKNLHSTRTNDVTDRNSKRDEQQQDSLNALMKEQEKSKVPRAVQKRRIVVLFHRPSSKQEHQISSEENRHSQNRILLPSSTVTENLVQISEPSDSSDNSEPEMADSLQLAAILAEIQLEKEWTPNESSSTKDQQTTLDSSKYEYDVTNLLDTTAFKLSPRTLKPDEELAARKRFAQYHLHEMRSSANAKIPSLLASIVTDNNSTIGNGIDIGQTFTFKLNTTDTIKKQSSVDDDDSETFESTTDSELVQLCYDATLKLLYDPKTGKYYDLSSA